MKARSSRTISLALIGATLGTMSLTIAVAQQRKPELGAMILMADGKRQRGFVQDSNDRGLLFTLVEGAPGTGYAWETQVTAVAFDDGDEIMREARAAFGQGNYAAAAQLLGAVADTYANVAWVPGNFASEARYFQLESLRLLGQWAEMAPLFQTPAAQSIPTRLGEFYQPQFKLNQVWAQLGAGQMDAVKTAVAALEKPVVGQAKLLPSPSFQEMPIRELVQVSFLRAKVNEADGKPELALEDYYRTFSVTFGNQPHLRDVSMKAALAIQSQNPAVQKEEGSPMVKRQIQSLAYLYKNGFGKGEIDPALAKFAVKPELPKPPSPDEEEAPEKPADGTTPAAPAAAPADAAGKAAPGTKGAADAKGAPEPAPADKGAGKAAPKKAAK